MHVGTTYKMLPSFRHHVKALNIVRIPVDWREVHPRLFGHPPADGGDDFGPQNLVLCLESEPFHLALPKPDILVSSSVIATARDPAEGDIFAFEQRNVFG